MRRLTLILSDLYLPDEAARDIATHSAVALPEFDALLRFARVSMLDDWRAWLARELGSAQVGDNLASAVARRLGLNVHGAWLATPVVLEARLDHVRMVGLTRIATDEAEQWRTEFARHFGPALELHAINDRTLLLTGCDAAAQTTDPARLIGTDVADALPRGARADPLRRLGAELEMWMHASAINTARERDRSARVSTLWLWGGGEEAAAGHTAADVDVRGGDPVLVALAPALAPAPSGFVALTSTREHAIVELAPLTGATHERLAHLETGWFAPLRAALRAGQVESLELVANDRVFRVTNESRWRFWRRRASWLELLGAPAAKA